MILEGIYIYMGQTVVRFVFFKIWSIFHSKFLVNWGLRRLKHFRSANQWYSITSWLGGFNSKVSEAWGRSSRWGAKLPMNRVFYRKPGFFWGGIISEKYFFQKKKIRIVWFFFVPANAQCSETDFALILKILRIFVFLIWSILYSTFVVNWGLKRFFRTRFRNAN